MEMTWQHKALAIKSLTGLFGFSLNMRGVGDWYVSANGVHRKEGGCLSGGFTSGKTPDEAVEQWWDWATDPGYYLVTSNRDGQRRAVKWNGFMWEDVDEETA